MPDKNKGNADQKRDSQGQFTDKVGKSRGSGSSSQSKSGGSSSQGKQQMSEGGRKGGQR